jgi:hypothetical protein
MYMSWNARSGFEANQSQNELLRFSYEEMCWLSVTKLYTLLPVFGNVQVTHTLTNTIQVGIRIF